MKIAAFQTPLDAIGSRAIINLLREQVVRCELQGVQILCFPEGVLGGLADYSSAPSEIAIEQGGELQQRLAPFGSASVTTIVGFTEIDSDRRLYNSAAVFHRGKTIGIYRKLHPAINKSVYHSGCATPVFTVGGLTFGILICRDTSFSEPAREMAAKGATAFFVPSNNGLPRKRATPELIVESRNADVARAKENNAFVIRADTAGQTDRLVSYGSSEIVDPSGTVRKAARQLVSDLLIDEIPLSACAFSEVMTLKTA